MKKRHETRRGIVYKNRHHAKLLIDELEVEEALWDLPIGRSDLEWLANRPITGTNRIGDPYYSQAPGELGDRNYERA